MAVYGLVIAGSGLAILSWSRYNHWRFAGRNQRRPSPPVLDAMIRERLGLAVWDLETMHAAKVMTLHLNEHGALRA